MVSWARSHLIDTRFTAMRQNLVQVNPSFELTNAATYTNLAANPSFETSAAYYTWRTNLATNPNLSTGVGSWSTGTTTHAAITGGRQFTVVNAGQQVIYLAGIAITPGTAASAQVRVGVPAGAATQTFRLLLRDQSAFVQSTDAVVTAGNQATLQFAGNTLAYTPSPGTTLRLEVLVLAAAVSDQFIIYDDVTVESVALLRPMFSGSSTYPDVDLTTAWSGTANASTSILRGLDPAGTFGGVYSSGWSRHGTRSLRRLGGSSSNDSYAVVASTTGGGSFGVILQAGKTYTVVAWLRQDQALTGTPSSNGSRIISFSGAGGNAGAGVKSLPQTNAAGVYEHRITFTVASNDYGQVRLYNGTVWGGGDVWWDDLVIVEGVYTGGYFDGTYKDDPDLIVSWTGTPNGSSSIAQDPSQATAVYTNMLQNPAGAAGGTAWTANGGIGEYSTGPALGAFATSARLTRVGAGATRFTQVAVPMYASTPYTLRFLARASEAVSMQVALRPTASSTAGQVTLATVNIPAGDSEHLLRGTTSTTTPSDTAAGVAWVLASGVGSIGATVDLVASLVQGTDDPGYVFDGSLPAIVEPPIKFAWNGAPAQSPSTLYGDLVRGVGAPSPVVRSRTNLVTRPRTVSGTPIVQAGSAVNWGGTAPTLSTIADATTPTGGGWVTQALSSVEQTTVIGQDGLFGTSSNRPAVTFNRPYTMSVYVRPSATISLRVSLQWLTSGGAGVSAVNGPNTSCPAGVWTRLTATGTPTNGTIAVVRPDIDWVANSLLPAGFTLDVDGLQIGQVAFVGSYFDGATPSTATVINAWTGTALASTSTQQILLNYATTGVVAYRGAGVAPEDGSYSARLVAGGTSNDTYISWGATHWFPWGLTPGRSYVVRATRYIGTPLTGTLNTDVGRIVVRVSRDGLTWDAAATVKSPAALNTAGRIDDLSVQVTIPADATGVAVVLYHGASQGNGDVWWDAMLVGDITGVAPADVRTSYFDGDYPWAAWTGAQDLSTSIGYRWALP